MTWLFFLIFLGVFGYQQYFTPPPTDVDQRFLTNALVVLSITVIAPFFVSYLFTRATQMTGRVPAILLGFISAIGLSVFGYWIVWKYFSGLSLQPVPVETALQMGLIPGVIMGVILATDSLFRRA
ncbi:MAG: hypothetical protein JNL06_04135 [Alphaproteobacteria bacterium]|nr:hypothetical protein [Alphaproteobacteria bacterium]